MTKNNVTPVVVTSTAGSASKLRRAVSTPMLILYGVGNIVGAGVYVLIGKIAEPAGYLSVLAFMVAAIVAFFSALSYAELAARFPVSAGVSAYLYEAFRMRRLAITLGTLLVCAGLISSAALIKGFAGYFGHLVPVPLWLGMILVVVSLLAVAMRGIKESVSIAATFTIIEVGGLLFLIGSIMWAQPDAIGVFGEHFSASLSTFDSTALAGVGAAAFIAFYAFVGFEDMVNIAEEVKEPQKAFPRAILASMALVTVLYTAVAVATLAILTPVTLGNSTSPLADAYHAATGNAGGIIAVISLIATVNGILVNFIMGSRFLYGMGQRGWIPGGFAKLSKRHVPVRGLLVVVAVALLFALWLPIERLAQLTSSLLLIVFLAVNISLIVVRRQAPARNFRISPTYMPWLGAICSVGLLVAQLLLWIL